ncbi:hypothetical protein SDC9_101778 [bioreactor metagenome]|uniref:Uncharacterized protein n=1 Tax=bioreactor metagenome TaxID=1076179 RepID=A0A645AVR7_9ZZZZ
MVGNQHDVSGTIVVVDSPGRICHDHGVAAHELCNPDREGDLVRCVAFVDVNAALHDHYIFARELSKDKIALVGVGGGDALMRDILIGDDDRIFYLVSQIAYAGAENDQHFRHKITEFIF